MLRILWFGEKVDQKNCQTISRQLPPRHVCRKISASVDKGAERRVSRAQTRERGPPSALSEFFVHSFKTIQCDDPYIQCENGTLKITQSQRQSLGWPYPPLCLKKVQRSIQWLDSINYEKCTPNVRQCQRRVAFVINTTLNMKTAHRRAHHWVIDQHKVYNFR